MKTYRSLLLVAALVGSAALLSAGPSTQFPSRSPAPKPEAAKATAPAKVTAPAHTPSAPMVATANCATCTCCKKST